uniref:Organic cation transporter protein n=1 Tax=Toxocara canis TaxID=6265 RepID=A0A183V6W3_TOXCA
LKDLQKCGVYVYFLTLTYAMMVFSQTINLLFMTFAAFFYAINGSEWCCCTDRKATAHYHCNHPLAASVYRRCNDTDCWISSNGTDSICNKTFTYDFGSIRNEFQINPEHVKLGTALQNIALLLGALVFRNLADVLLGASIGLAISELASSFVNNFWTFTVARFVVNFFNGGKHCTCSPYLMENLPDVSRMWIATLVTYSPMYVVLAGLAFFCKDWRTLARASAAITLIPLIMLLFVQETPRWLIQKGRDVAAERAVLKIKRWDGKITDDLRESIHSVVESESEREREKRASARSYNSLYIFKSWTLTKYAIVFSTSLFSASFVSYGIAFNLEALAGTVYVNVIILGASRYAINILAVLMERASKRVGRRLLHIGSITFIVIVIAAVMIVHISAHNDLNAHSKAKREGREGEMWVEALYQFNRIAALLGAAMCTEIFVLNAVQPPELFPTPIRGGSNAFIQMFNRLGTILSPLLFKPASANLRPSQCSLCLVVSILHIHLQDRSLAIEADWWAPAPYFLMTATSVADLVLYSMWIPETRGKPIPDKMPPEILEKEGQTDAQANASVSVVSQSETVTMAPTAILDRRIGRSENQLQNVDVTENDSATGSITGGE